MRWGRRAAALALIAAVAGGGLRVAGAQSITISVPIANDSISPAPPILVEGTPGPPSLGPYSLTLEAALEPQFRAPIIISASSDLTLSVQADSLFPEHAAVFFRARLIDGQGQVIRQDLRSFNVRSWLRLISPTRLSNDVLFTRQPRFVWSSPGITLPPGPWRYTLSIINTKNGHEDFQFQPTDTSFVVPTPLEACTSYSWRLTARAINGGSKNQITVASPGTFVIQTAECPTATIFYQNFPNPFGHGSMSDITCFWFDLAREANVKLTIYDVRLRAVRSIIPGNGSGRFAGGAYGRLVSGGGGCDPRFSWDGRDNEGRLVPSGVYIAAFEADGVRTTKKILFLGQ